MTEVKKIAHNTLIQMAGKVITTIIALAAFGLMTRHLGQVGFGYFSTIYAFLAIFGILIDLGLQMTTTKLIADPNENEAELLSNALTMRLIASLLFLGIAPLVIAFFPYPTIVKQGATIAVLGFVFASLTATITSFFQKNLVMQQVAVAEIVAKIIYLVAIIVAITANLGLLGIIGAVVLDSMITFLLLYYFAARKAPLRPSFNVAVWKKILTHTWPIAVTITLNLIYFKGDIFIMSLIRSQAEVGLYGAPYRILEVAINIVYLFLGLILPLLATAYATKNIDRFKTVMQSSFDAIIIIVIPMIIGGLLLGRELMVVMAGPDFVISGDIIKILLVATGTIFIASLLGYGIVAIDKQKEMIKFYAVNAIISIIGYVYLISEFSYWGAAWMTVATEIFILLTAGYVLYKHTKFTPKIITATKALIASGVMAGFLYILPPLHFFWLLLLGVIIYFVSLYLFKGIDKKILREIISK